MGDKTSITDVTFLIPVRVDSMVRLENLLMVVDFLLTHFSTRIHILEATSYNNGILRTLLPSDVQLTFIEDCDPVFHRTKYINVLVSQCQTPYLAVWDTDVIVPPEQIVESVAYLREEKADFVYPYEKKFLDTTFILRELYLKTRDLKLLKKHAGKMPKLYLPNPVGGAFFADKDAYSNSGMENEHFYGWGREDGDRINRWEILGYTVRRVSGPLFHFTHERGVNSSFHSEDQDSIKMSEIFRVISMSRDELKDEIDTWKHLKPDI